MSSVFVALLGLVRLAWGMGAKIRVLLRVWESSFLKASNQVEEGSSPLASMHETISLPSKSVGWYCRSSSGGGGGGEGRLKAIEWGVGRVGRGCLCC